MLAEFAADKDNRFHLHTIIS